MPESHTYCPRCRGSGRIGNSPSDPDARWCDLCRGSGNLAPGQTVPSAPTSRVFEPGEALALTKVGVRSSATVVAVLVAVALPLAAVIIVVTWWTAAHEQLRSVLELLPESVVARTAAGEGQPWVVAIGVLVLTALAVGGLSVSRRRSLFNSGSSAVPYLWGVVRAVVLVGGLGLAAAAGPIASGADLREEPTVFSEPWHIGLVAVLVVAYAVLGTRRLIARRSQVPLIEPARSPAVPAPPGSPAPPVPPGSPAPPDPRTRRD